MNCRILTPTEFPQQLLQIADPPKQLYLEGILPPTDAKLVCVVGARKYTTYGKDVCEKLIASLHGTNVCIVSGLAIGIDTIAHKAALRAGLHVLAIPGSGLNRSVLYPSINRSFADEIVARGGGLISEFEPDFVSTMWAFPKRNRIMAALSHAVLIIEAEKKSGTLITSRLATDYNKDVLAVPGSIFSKNSEGPHLLLKLGAIPITSNEDLHQALGLNTLFDSGLVDNIHDNKERYADCNELEKKILELLQDPLSKDELVHRMQLPTYETNILLSLLEMKGYIKESMGQFRLS